MAMHLLTMLEYLAKNNMADILHAPYSPDLPSCEFFLFLILKMALKGTRFNDVTMIQAKLGAVPAK
jgi:hypothetical protein